MSTPPSELDQAIDALFSTRDRYRQASAALQHQQAELEKAKQAYNAALANLGNLLAQAAAGPSSAS